MAKYPLVVIDGHTRTPFLRGVLTRSLTKRGLGFKEAYRISDQVRSRFLEQGQVSRDQLRETVDAVLQDKYGSTLHVPVQAALPETITVEGTEVVPFSKGILTRSLHAAGLDPSDGYSIAFKIQAELLSGDRKSIARRELRRLVYETLADLHGEDLAERYLVWRYVRSPEKPFGLLFGGSSGAGKTLLATDVAHRLGIAQVVSTDSIREIMRMMFSRDLLPTIHYSSYEAWKSLEFSGGEETGVVDAFRQQARRVLVGVTALLDRAVQERNSLVIEGVHLVPGLLNVAHLRSDAHIVHVVIANLDRDDYLLRFPEREKEEEARSAERYMSNIDSIMEIQDYILEMAHQSQTVIVENRTLDETVPRLLQAIADALRERLNLGGGELVKHAL